MSVSVLLFLVMAGLHCFSQPGPNLALTAVADQSGGSNPDLYNDGELMGISRFGSLTVNTNPDPNAWIELDWGNTLKQFDQLTIYLDDFTDNAMNSAIIQIWNGSGYINWDTFYIAKLKAYSYTVKFPAVTTSRLRLTNPGYIGLYHINIEEIEVRLSTKYHNDAGIVALNLPTVHILPGLSNVTATAMNMGLDTLKSLGLEWSVNGILQTSPPLWTGLLPKLKSDSNISLGSYNFTIGVFRIKVWTINPNSNTDSNFYNDTFQTIIYSGSPAGGTYIIDRSGSGDFSSFTDASKWLMQCGMNTAVKFRVKPGNYQEQFYITKFKGLSAVNTLIYESFNLDSTSVNLNYSTTSVNKNYVVLLNDVSHICFRNLTIQSSNSSIACAVTIANGSDSNTFINNILKIPEGDSNNLIVISFTNWLNGTFRNEYNLIKNNLITGGYYGVYMEGYNHPKYSFGNIIEANQISNFRTYGIMCIEEDGLIINGNTLVNSLYSTGAYGIYQSRVSNGIISFNKITINGGTSYGMYLSDLNDFSTSAAFSKIHNNFVSASSTTFSTVYGISAYYCSNVDFSYNSINTYNSTASNYTLYFYNNGDSSINLRNNIISNFSGGYAIYMSYNMKFNLSDYNDLYTSGTNLVNWNGAYTNLAAWQTASGGDIHSLSTNPGYYSMTDLHLNTIGINNKAIPLTGYTTDIDGASRSATSPDMGADEFDLILNDAGVNAIIAPLVICPGTSSISVKIKNFGTDTLHNVQVNWSVNGSLQTAVPVTTMLTQYQENILLLGNYTFSPGTKYILKFWTTLPNGHTDGKSSNDTFIFIMDKTGLSGTYTIGAVGSDYKSFNEAVNDLVKNGICGPVKFRIRPGAYHENVLIPAIHGSSALNTIIFESYYADSNSVDLYYASGSSSNNYVVKLMGADYITFRQIKIRATGSFFGYAVYLCGEASHNTFTNNIIKTRDTASTNTFACFFSDATNENYTTIKNCFLSGGYYSVYLYGNLNISMELNNIVQNNIIRNFFEYGIYAEYQSSPQFTGNYLENSNSSTDKVYGLYLSRNNDSLKVVKNKINIHGLSADYGIYNQATNNSTSVIYGLFANNFISISGSSGADAIGIKVYYSWHQYIYNNNIHVAVNSTSYGSALVIQGGGDISVVNNVLANSGGGYACMVFYPTSISNANYNDLYETGGPYLGRWGIINCTDISGWKSASAKETNSVSFNPFFTSATDLHISARALDSAGIALPQIHDDIDNEPRNNVSPDIGADEFRVYNYDASIVSLISPVLACQGTATHVTIMLRNYGNMTIRTTNIKCTINGVKFPVFHFNGILPGQKDTVLTLGTYTFLKATAYDIKIWVDTINSVPDEQHGNDSVIIKNFKASLSGTYTIGSSGKDYTTFSEAVSDLVNIGICAPVLFLVDPGIYNEHFCISSVPGASATNTITFRSADYDSTKVVIRYAAKSALDNYVIQLKNASYIRIENMTMKAMSSIGFAIVIDFKNGSNYNIIKSNLLISNNLIYGSNSSVIYSDGRNSSSCYNLIDNNFILLGSHGIYFNGNSTVSPSKCNIFRNNTITDYQFTGILVYYQDSVEISNNYIRSAGNCGIGCNYLSGGCSISNNQIYLSGTYMIGLEMRNCAGKSAAYMMVINNMIGLKNLNSYAREIGIDDEYGSYHRYYHNTIKLSGGGNSPDFCCYFDCYSSGSYGNIELQNNIFSNTGPGYIYYFGTNAVNLGYVHLCNYNDISFSGAKIAKFSGADISSLVSWISGSSLDSKSITVIPSFVSDFDLHLAAVSALTVANYTGVNHDFDGEARSINTPYAGADEFVTWNYDASLVSLVSPYTSCSGITSAITVRLKNCGKVTINTIKIHCMINGVRFPDYNFVGSLAYLKDTLLTTGSYIFLKGISYEIKIWTDSINGVPDQKVKNNMLLIHNFHTSLSGTMTIGQSGRDYSTFTDAVNDLITYGVCGPVLYLADSGVYDENIFIPAITGASAINTITFRSAVNDSTKVILNYAAAGSNDNYLVQLTGAQYIRIEKMTFQSTGKKGYDHIICLGKGANNNIIRNNVLLSGNSMGGNVINSPTDSPSCSNNLFENNIVQNGYYGIYFYGNPNSPGKNNIFRKNKITGFNNFGMAVSYQDSAEIDNCLILGDGGIGIECDNLGNGCKISANQINLSYNNGSSRYGLYLRNCKASPNSYMMIFNNMISINSNYNSQNIQGICSDKGFYQRFYHNSVRINSSSALNCAAFYVISNLGSNANIDLQNNIISTTNSVFAIEILTDYNNLKQVFGNYNDIYCTGKNFGRFNNKDAGSFSDWQTLSGLDSNSFSIYPSFKSDSDLHLKNTLLLTVPNYKGINSDIDGEPRDLKNPYAGADELPMLLNDAGIKAITSPSEITCEGILPVTATLYNYGSNVLGSVLIDYIVNGVLKSTLHWSGALASRGFTAVSLAVDTFFAGKSVDLKIRTRLPNGKNTDIYAFNDADSVYIKVYATPVITSVLGDSACEGDTATLRVFSGNTKIFTWYDSVNGGNFVCHDSVFNFSPADKTRDFYVEAAIPGFPNHLSTLNLGGNVEMGNMFDITSKIDYIVIDSFAVLSASPQGTAFPVAVYYKAGTYKGFETQASAWKLLGIDTVISNGITSFTNVSTGGIVVYKGKSAGIYVTTTDMAYLLNYTGGAGSFSDTNIKITSGTAAFYPFDKSFTGNQSWNGTVYYETGTSCHSARVPVHAKILAGVHLGKDTVLYDKQSVTLDAGSSFDTYFWSNGSSQHQITVDSTGIGYNSREFWVSVSNDWCNSTDTIRITFRKISSIDEKQGEINVRIYPDPAQSLLNIETSGSDIRLMVKILDARGKIVKVCRLNPQNGKFAGQVDISALSAGVYFIQLYNDRMINMQRFMKE